MVLIFWYTITHIILKNILLRWHFGNFYNLRKAQISVVVTVLSGVLNA